MNNIKGFLKKNAYLGISALLFLSLTAGFFIADKLRKKEYRIVCLGDSLIGNVRDDTSIAAVLGEELGVSVYNGAFGGTTASARNQEERASISMDCISLTELTDSICYGNFSVPNASINRCSSMDYFPGAVYDFNRVDLNKVEVLIIEHGVNDYLVGAPLDNAEDPYDVYTFGGSLRYALSTLKEERPDIRILLCTPTYCWFLADEVSCEERRFRGGYLEDYVNLELEIADEFGVAILDNYHESGIGGEFENWPDYTEDGLHLNETGRRLIAERIAEAVKRMEETPD